jgi:hypothetical protein
MYDIGQLQNADFEKQKKMLMRHARKRDKIGSKNASDFYIESIFTLGWMMGFTATARHRGAEREKAKAA